MKSTSHAHRTGVHISEVSSAGGYYFPEYPRDIVEDNVAMLEDKTILDCGAGFGNNTKLLLEKTTSKIVATETLPEALEKLAELQKDFPGRLVVKDQAVQELADIATYDAVICTMVLHFLPDNLRKSALQKIKAATKVSGLNIISAYIFDEGLLKYEHFLSGFAPDELKDAYNGWEILGYKEVMPVNPMKGIQHFKSAKIVTLKNEAES
ncbi:MAG: methyltransferase [Candidatus Saccharimonadales bacterium]